MISFHYTNGKKGLSRLVGNHYFRAVFQDNLNAFVWKLFVVEEFIPSLYNTTNVITVLGTMVSLYLLVTYAVKGDQFLLCAYLGHVEHSFPWVAFQSHSVAHLY